VRKGKPRIPPGAPGHPRASSDASGGRAKKARAPREARSSREGPPHESPSRRAAPTRRAAPARARLIYRDEDILAYDKPAGLPVIAAEGSRSRSLLDLATEEVKRGNPKGRAAVVHRIDRDTSGVVVFATKARVKKELMGGWDELVSERRYVALVEGSMGGKSGTFDSWLKENKGGQVFRAGIGERGAKRAITRWRLLGEGSGLSLLELSLETGRKHQIRVQLADSAHPVVGDPRYGGDGLRRDGALGRGPLPDLGRLCLHAASIELSLPGREALRIESPAPPEFAAALGRSPEGPRERGATDDPRGDERKPPAISGRKASASASRSAGRGAAPPRRGAPRGKKPPSRP
jgi:23S rRNA pseudouridine1911/1915/1917 synthase